MFFLIGQSIKKQKKTGKDTRSPCYLDQELKKGFLELGHSFSPASDIHASGSQALALRLEFGLTPLVPLVRRPVGLH